MTTTAPIDLLTADDVDRLASRADAARGLGALTSVQGPLPLRAVRIDSRIVGLTAATTLRQTFENGFEVPIEATYVFPLPERAAVTGFTFTVGDRWITGALRERAQARADYDAALADGHRAAITEEERPGTFTMRVGNLGPGERAEVELELAGPVAHEDGEATFRFPLVVAPRYVAGSPLGELDPRRPPVGSGGGADTDLVPDASRVTPPLLPDGAPPTVALEVSVAVDGGGLAVRQLRSSLHGLTSDAGPGGCVVRLEPSRLDRDLILRWRLEPVADAAAGDHEIGTGLVVTPDAGTDGDGGTFTATVVAPTDGPAPSRVGRDLVVVLDRSGSMQGWKMVSARRAAARLIDRLDATDRFAVLAFDTRIDRPPGQADRLVEATDRNRFVATEFLAAVEARGGTEMQTPLVSGLRLLTGTGTGTGTGVDGDRDGAGERHRVLVLVTDGQVAGEDHLLRALGSDAGAITIHTVGIDRAVNAGLLQRLAAAGGGHCDLVESDERLDEVLVQLGRRIDPPVVRDVVVRAEGVELDPLTVSPDLGADVVAGVPLVIRGRYRGTGAAARWWVEATSGDGRIPLPLTAREVPEPALTSTWARAHLRDLEDGYAVAPAPSVAAEIVATSLRFSTLCRFTAFVAVDEAEVIDPAGRIAVTQPVERPDGWATSAPPPGLMAASASAGAFAAGAPMIARAGLPAPSRARIRRTTAPMAAAPPPADLATRIDEALAEVAALTFPMRASLAVLHSEALRRLAAEARGSGQPDRLVDALERLAEAVAARDDELIRAMLEVVRETRRSVTRPR